MKIAILTQPLITNYGGLLQAWALQRKLLELGHDVTFINRLNNPVDTRNAILRFLSFIKDRIYVLLGWRQQKPKNLRPIEELLEYSAQFIAPFKKSNYRRISRPIYSDEELINYVKKQNFEGYVVGSDQVWRPRYSPGLMNYFLDFIGNQNDVKKIAYAASFGVDNWEFTKSQTKKASKLAKLFDFISVREDSAIELVKHHFNCEAIHVLDPTLLIDKSEYETLVENPSVHISDCSGNLFCYVLDSNPQLSEIIKRCMDYTTLTPFYCNAKKQVRQLTDASEVEDCIAPPVEQWLKSFMDAKMVVTDSFHGCVFSIIFNKPFWVLSNSDRGSARFNSLLKQFALENRLVESADNIDWNIPIDWDSVNKKKRELASKSSSLLKDALES